MSAAMVAQPSSSRPPSSASSNNSRERSSSLNINLNPTTKRAHSSDPSPASSPTILQQLGQPGQQQHSPKISRTKLANSSPNYQNLNNRQPDLSAFHAPLVGLGVSTTTTPSSSGSSESSPATYPMNGTTTTFHQPVLVHPQQIQQHQQTQQLQEDREIVPAVSAQEQTRKLLAMPVQLSSHLSRLSSQHHLSEYNVLKRVVAQSLANPQQSQYPYQQQLQSHNQYPQLARPIPGPSLHPHAAANAAAQPLATRSHSSPPVDIYGGIVPAGPEEPQIISPSPTVVVVSGNSNKPLPPRWSSLAAPVPGSGTRSVPNLSRAATPPRNIRPSPSSTVTDSNIRSTSSPNNAIPSFSSVGVSANTSLTPTMGRFGFPPSTATTPDVPVSPSPVMTNFSQDHLGIKGPERDVEDEEPAGVAVEQEQDVAKALDEALRSTLERQVPAAAAVQIEQQQQIYLQPTVLLQPSILPSPVPSPALAQVPQQQLRESSPLLPGMQIINGFAVKTSASHPMNISPILPPELLSTISQRLFSVPESHHQQQALTSASSPKPPRSPLMTIARNNSNELENGTPFVLKCPPSVNLWAVACSAPTSSGPTPPPATEDTSVLPPAPALSISPSQGGGGAKPMGNFFLSSCPGKKVRLGAPPVKGGRSGICRDLRMDLQRAKDEGVGLVVCCLDDQELGFLGAPWEEYSRTAQSLELGVIRIPMVEGFAPSSPAALDAHLSRIIRQHTLRGESVLAHCRGGIGRAGLVACCWILKCGLVGEIAGRGVSSGEEEDWLLGNGQAMAVVERVIDVIRKRRSVKAIETPQQVHFLLDYVTYLQTQAKTVRASDI